MSETPRILDNDARNKSLQLFEKMTKDEAMIFKGKIAEWSNLNLAYQELMKNPAKNQALISDIVEMMDRIKNETAPLSAVVLRRCLTLAQEGTADMDSQELQTWLQAMTDSSAKS